MASIVQSPTTVIIDDNTVNESVGLCRFDYETESLLEIDSISGMFLPVDLGGAAMKKMYLVTDPVDVLNYVKLSFKEPENNQNVYSIKVIISNEEPSFEAFSALPSFNTYVINNPAQGVFMSAWILVENLLSLDEIVELTIEIEYD
jgi:hypothetical protein